MTVTGYKAPRSTVLHRPNPMRIAATTFLRTYCGFELPGDHTWDVDAKGEAYTCRQCRTAYDSEQHARAPWADGERRVYTSKRRPGLHSFQRDKIEGQPMGYHWRLLARPRPSWRTTRDHRAPADRPWRLCIGDDYGRGVGYFTTTTEAVDFTHRLEAAGLVDTILKQANTDAWDEGTSALALLASAQPKETNPA